MNSAPAADLNWMTSILSSMLHSHDIDHLSGKYLLLSSALLGVFYEGS
jgi:hypothetical protein